MSIKANTYVLHGESVVPTLREAILEGGGIASFDTETYYNKDTGGIIRYIEDSPNNKAFCLTVSTGFDEQRRSFYIHEDSIPYTKEILEDETITKVLHNYNFDAHILLNDGIEIRGTIYDTMMMIHLIDEEMMCLTKNGKYVQSKSLKNLGYHFLSADAHEYEEAIKEVRKAVAKRRGVAPSRVSYKEIFEEDPDAMINYATYDTDITLDLFPIFKQSMTNEGLWNAYETDFNASVAVLAMERVGIGVDRTYYTELSGLLTNEIDAVRAEIVRLGFPVESNLNANREVVKMFQRLGVDWKWVTEKGEYQVSDDVLKRFTEGDTGTLASCILKYRECTKLRDTFVAQMLRFSENQPDGRVHANFNICPREERRSVAGGTVTGRMSSSNPNFQNIPKEDKRVRKGIIPTKDYAIFSIDYSQQEYRLLGVYANDRNFNEVIANGIDIHVGTAQKMFHLTMEQAHEKKYRSKGKTCNFALVYGTGNANFASMIGIPIDATLYNKGQGILRELGYKPWETLPPPSQILANHSIVDPVKAEAVRYYFSEEARSALQQAADLKQQYFNQFPSIQQFLKDCTARAKGRGYIVLWDGRRRHFKKPKEEAYKAPNALIQGGCGSITKAKMWEIHNFLLPYKSRIVNVIHDDITIEIHKDEFDLVKKIMKIMEVMPFPSQFVFAVDAEYSFDTWGDMKHLGE